MADPAVQTTRSSASDVDLSLRLAEEGIAALRDALLDQHEEIDRAVEIIMSVNGRLVVTGLGKSGHIAGKLAATFASTGTPAYFVHPSEASHGDLGMVHSDDAVLMLSWSGNTRELVDLINYTRRSGIPLIAVTGNANSKLAQASDVALILPKVTEACPHNLAPTTSTTLQIAIGDALATAILRRKDFNPGSFHRFHPGGQLGASLAPLSEIAVSGGDLPLVRSDATVLEVISELTAKSLGIVGVCQHDGTLAGVITDGDIRRFFGVNFDVSVGQAMKSSTAESICTQDFKWFAPEEPAGAALEVLKAQKITAAFLLTERKPVGCVTMHHLLNSGLR